MHKIKINIEPTLTCNCSATTYKIIDTYSKCLQTYKESQAITFKTSCSEDMLPNGLGDRGSDGGWSRGLAGAILLAPKELQSENHKRNFKQFFFIYISYRCRQVDRQVWVAHVVVVAHVALSMIQ